MFSKRLCRECSFKKETIFYSIIFIVSTINLILFISFVAFLPRKVTSSGSCSVVFDYANAIVKRPLKLIA